jgi:hypothetical protein
MEWWKQLVRTLIGAALDRRLCLIRILTMDVTSS